jgi:hypothetical protein
MQYLIAYGNTAYLVTMVKSLYDDKHLKTRAR